MVDDIKMSITGFGCKYNILDADGVRVKFSQKFKYISSVCPDCKAKCNLLYPAVNQCAKCKSVLVFCAVNDGDDNIGVFSINNLSELQKEIRKK